MTVQAARSPAPATRPHDKGFVMQPRALIYDSRLRSEHRHLWVVLEDLQRDEPFVDATAHQLAHIIGCSDDTIERQSRVLEATGWLKVQRRRGFQRANRYKVLGSPRRTGAGTGTRTDARTDAGSMEGAPVRVPTTGSTTNTRNKEVLSSPLQPPAASPTGCPNTECDHGWIFVEVEGRNGPHEAVRRCPGCNTPTPAF